MEEPLHAVMTGDVVGSTRFDHKRKALLAALHAAFELVHESFPELRLCQFEMFRGDSFQGVLSPPEPALRAALMMRASLRCAPALSGFRPPADVRLALGIGATTGWETGQSVSEADGEPFALSGPTLDAMKRGDQLLRVRTVSEEINAELDVECALADALVSRWSVHQAQVVLAQLRGVGRKRMARELDVTVQAVGQRLRLAGVGAVEKLLERYETLIARLPTSAAAGAHADP